MHNLINDDCFDVMDKMTHNGETIDMILTDPPYDIATQGGSFVKNRNGWNELENLSISNGFDINKFLLVTLGLFKSKDYYNEVYFHSKNQIYNYLTFAIQNELQYNLGVWHKTNPPPLCGGKYLTDVEYWIQIKGKKSPILGDYHSKSLVYQSSINKSDKDLYGHPTCKPVELMKKFLYNHTNVNDLIFDPFMGSGSTGHACLELNRNFKGVELTTKYYNIANERLSKLESKIKTSQIEW